MTFFPKLEPIIDELWRSPFERKGSIFQASVNFHICYRTNINHPRPLNPFTWNPSSKAKNHSLRFKIWKASPMVRFFIESPYILLLTLFMQLVLVEIQLLVKDLDENQFARLDAANSAVPVDEIALHNIHVEVADEIILMMEWFLSLEYCLILLGSFLLQPLFDFCA